MPSPDESWNECPEGELAELRRSLKDQENRIKGRRKLLFAAGTLVIGIASAGLGIYVTRKIESTSILSCEETIDLLPQYADGTIASISELRAVEKHLNHCKMCREYFEQMY